MNIPRGAVRSLDRSRRNFTVHCGRRTPCLVTAKLHRSFFRQAMRACSEAAQDLGANFICFDGGVLAPAASQGAAEAAEANVLYELVGPDAVDGAAKVETFPLPDPLDPARFTGLCEAAIRVRDVGQRVEGFGNISAGIFEMLTWMSGCEDVYANWGSASPTA